MCVRVHAKLLQLCPTVCDPVDYSLLGPNGFSVRGILQARVLESVVTMPSSRGSSRPSDQTQNNKLKSVSRTQGFKCLLNK